jgi:hypothetical protein
VLVEEILEKKGKISESGVVIKGFEDEGEGLRRPDTAGTKQ